MINRILKIKGRKLNKSGFTLIEVFFSFLLLITISVLVINAFSKKDSTFDEVKEYERDYEQSLRAVSKALLFTGVEDNYKIHLTNYIPMTNVENRNELHLINTYSEQTGEVVFDSRYNRYELFHRFNLGETIIETKRDRLLDDYRASITINTHKLGKFDYKKASSLKVKERGTISEDGVFFTVNTRLYKQKLDTLNFNNILVHSDKNESEVIYYEETF